MSSVIDSAAIIVKQLGLKMGFNNLQLGNSNHCCLCFDNKYHVHITCCQEVERITFLGDIGTIDEEHFHFCCERLLKANSNVELTHGAAIAKEQDSNKTFLTLHLPLSILESSPIDVELIKFIDWMKEWTEELIEIQQGRYDQESGEESLIKINRY